MSEIEKAVILTRCRDYLAEQSIEVTELDDFDEVHDLISRVGKSYLTPFTSPSHNDLTEGNALWLVAKKENEPVMMGCARLEELGQEPIERYWRRAFARAYGDKGAGPVHSVQPEIARKVAGRLVYFGDLYVAAGVRGMRSNLRFFTTIGHMAVSLKWDPDHTYAFIRERDVMRGAGTAYGFSWFVPSPFQWSNLPYPRSSTEWAAFVSRADVLPMARQTSFAAQTINDA